MKDYKTPFYIFCHPFEGYQELKYHRWGNTIVSTVSVLLLFLALIVKRQLSGFPFTINTKLNDLNVPLIFAESFGLCLAFSVVNWAICTLMDGNGKIKDVWVILGYSLAPYTVSVLFSTLLSRFLTVDEAVFLTTIEGVALFYSVFLILKGLETFHEYSFLQAAVSAAVTLLGMVLVVLVFILLFSISQQFVSFFITIFQEISLRR